MTRSRHTIATHLPIAVLVAAALTVTVMLGPAPAADATMPASRDTRSQVDATPAVAGAASADLPGYRSWVGRVTRSDLGPTWKPGCPVAPSQLREVGVRYVGFDGQAHEGSIIVHKRRVYSVRRIFQDLYHQQFPIRRMETMDFFRGNDDRSMAWDNTSGFNCRKVTGGTSWSRHSYGVAIDLNPRENPYVNGSTVLPWNTGDYVDRDRDRPGMLQPGSAAVRAFTSRDYDWGGAWRTLKDYQHFER